MPKKLSYDDVKDYINSYGYNLISKEYNNNNTKLSIQCPDNHIFKMTYANFKQGRRCSYCHGNKKHTYTQVKDYIESRGYKLLSKEYKNANTKLKLQCPEEHTFEMTYGNFYSNHRCPECSKKKYGQYHKLSYDEVKEYIESYNYKLLSTKYNNNNIKLKLQCPIGHNFEMKYNNFQIGQRCPECSKKKYGQYHKLSYDEVKEYIESYDYKLLSNNYKNAHGRLKLLCPHDHVFEMKYNNFQIGQRCPICYFNSTSSQPEKEIQEYIRSIYNGKIINNDRNTVVNPLTGYNLELDIYLPKEKKAIEFNGTYWHSLDKVQLHDKIKEKQCKEMNINLMTIKENE